MHNNFDSMHNVFPGRHLYQFYKTHDDYLQILMPFFAAGLEKGDACLWLASEKIGIEKIENLFREKYPEFSMLVKSPQFQITSAEDWYLINGRFSEEHATQNAQRYVKFIQNQGFKRLRGAGDAGVIPREDWGSLEAYEKNIDLFVKSMPVIGLCAYPILDCSLKETRMVIDCHDDVLVGHL